ncbi:MAG TPA: hypothetical protein VMQ54_14365 [Steroidobacteraceae bacterium]|jgi:hypothetical protein|nr:hypothetical protein [Steroidobacteraceae bacterium]
MTKKMDVRVEPARSLRLFTGQFAGRRHAVVKRDRIEVVAVRPSERAKLDEDAGKKAGSFSGRTISPSRAVVEEKSCTPAEPSENVIRNRKPPSGFTATTSIIWSCDPEAAAVRLRMIPVLRSPFSINSADPTSLACLAAVPDARDEYRFVRQDTIAHDISVPAEANHNLSNIGVLRRLADVWGRFDACQRRPYCPHGTNCGLGISDFEKNANAITVRNSIR